MPQRMNQGGKWKVEQYLSIGEMAKLMGVSIKALRYYEKLGILKPAYINEETGYRYYLPEQIMVLDFILLCLELKLPLKQFSGFDPNGDSMDVEKILQSAQRKAETELARIQRTIRKLHNMSQHLDAVDNLMQCNGCVCTQNAKYLLLKPIDANCSVKQYNRELTSLYDIIDSNNLISCYEQGILIYSSGENIGYYLFVAIEPPETELNCMSLSIPAGQFFSEYCPEENALSCFQKYLTQCCENIETPVMFISRYQRHISGRTTDTQVLHHLGKQL